MPKIDAGGNTVEDRAIIRPAWQRKFAEGKSKSLQGVAPRPFDVVSWNIAEWTKTG